MNYSYLERLAIEGRQEGEVEEQQNIENFILEFMDDLDEFSKNAQKKTTEITNKTSEVVKEAFK